MNIELLIPIGSALVAIAVAWGVTKATVTQLEKRTEKDEESIDRCSNLSLTMGTRIDGLESRIKEDREHNEKQHEEFYSLKDSVIVLNTLVPEIIKRLNTIEEQNKMIIERLPERRGGK